MKTTLHKLYNVNNPSIPSEANERAVLVGWGEMVGNDDDIDGHIWLTAQRDLSEPERTSGSETNRTNESERG